MDRDRELCTKALIYGLFQKGRVLAQDGGGARCRARSWAPSPANTGDRKTLSAEQSVRHRGRSFPRLFRSSTSLSVRPSMPCRRTTRSRR